MNENPFIHVRSSKFTVLPGEDEELVNEGMYGKAVAIYLNEKLKTAGYASPFFCCEDWGWWVEVSGLGCTAGVGIYGVKDDTSNELSLSVTVWPQPGRVFSWRRFKYIDFTPVAQKLHADVLQIFKSDPDVTILGITDDAYWK